MSFDPSTFSRHRSTTTGSYVTERLDIFNRTFTGVGCNTNPYGLSSWSTSEDGIVTVKDIYDHKTLNFRARLKKGEFLPPLPVYIKSVTTHKKANTFDMTVTVRGGPCNGTQVQYSDGKWQHNRTPFMSHDDITIDEDQLSFVINRAVAAARQASYDALTEIGELQESAQLCRTLGSLLAKAVDEVAVLTKKVGYAKALANVWLSYRYGVMPIVHSVNELLEVSSRESRKFKIGRSSSTGSGNDSLVTNTTVATGWYRNYTETISWDLSYRGWGAAKFDYLSERFAFDPVVSAWELSTLTFVLDWFIDVGSYLAAISPTSAGSTLGSSNSVVLRSDYRQQVHYFGTNNATHNHNLDYNHETLSIITESYHRYPASPSLPGWNPRLTIPRITDILAIGFSLRNKLLPWTR